MAESNTWEERENLKNAKEAIKEFKREYWQDMEDVVTPLENFLWKYSMGYILYPWISLLEPTLEISYKPQT